jgi:hypothetical protein
VVGRPGNQLQVASMDGARRIWAMGPGATLGQLDQHIWGRAYLYAILRDPRIAG